jgi:excinuclease ABC subunit A
VRGRKGEYHQLLQDFYEAGFLEVRVDGKVYSLRESVPMQRYAQHTIELVVDRVPVGWPLSGNNSLRSRLAEAIEVALDKASDAVNIVFDDASERLMSARFSCPDDGFAFPDIEPRLFSFNSPYGAYCNSENIESVTDKNQYFINKNINTQLKVHPDRLKEYAELKDLILKEQLLSIPKIYKFKESVIRDSLQKCYDKKYSEIVDILPDFFSFLYKHNYIQID